jgi:hypothetical protein
VLIAHSGEGGQRLPSTASWGHASSETSSPARLAAYSTPRPKSKAHPGAHRGLHPNPTHSRDILAEHCPHCRADVSGIAQEAVQTYDRIEIPEIRPDVTRVRLHGGICPCCTRKFVAAAPAASIAQRTPCPLWLPRLQRRPPNWRKPMSAVGANSPSIAPRGTVIF